MGRSTPRWAAGFMRRSGLTVDDLIGFRFAVNVALATIIVTRVTEAAMKIELKM